MIFETSQSWSLEGAVKQAYEAAKDHNKRPWIKSGGQILDEFKIKQVMSGLRAMGTFRADRS